MWIVVTDLDGTLLNHEDYSWEAARGALASLDSRGVPVVFCTSKTRAEAEILRKATGNRHPFIIENGGAVYLPATAFGHLSSHLARHENYLRISLGTSYPTLVKALAESAAEAGCTIQGFADASDLDVAEWCGFTVAEAKLARQREFDEPFLLRSGDGNALAEAIAKRGLQTTRGGRFWHILGKNDKGTAVRQLCRAYSSAGVAVELAALGDSPNDLPMLALANLPILMPGARLSEMKSALPHATVAPQPGARGWGEALQSAIPGWFRGLRQSDVPFQHFSF